MEHERCESQTNVHRYCRGARVRMYTTGYLKGSQKNKKKKEGKKKKKRNLMVSVRDADNVRQT